MNQPVCWAVNCASVLVKFLHELIKGILASERTGTKARIILLWSWNTCIIYRNSSLHEPVLPYRGCIPSFIFNLFVSPLLMFPPICFQPMMAYEEKQWFTCWGPVASHLFVLYFSKTPQTVSLLTLPMCCTDEHPGFSQCKPYRSKKKTFCMLITMFVFLLCLGRNIFSF